MTAPRSEKSLGQLFGQLASGTGELLRQELRLAAFEVVDKAGDASGKMGVIALGGGLAHAGLLGLLVAAALGLSAVIPLWAAALLLGAVFFAAGAAIVVSGLRALERPAAAAVAGMDHPSPPNLPLVAEREGARGKGA